MHSDGSGTRNWIFRVPREFKASFFAKKLQYMMIFQSFEAPLAHSTLKNHQLFQKIGKKKKKSL